MCSAAASTRPPTTPTCIRSTIRLPTRGRPRSFFRNLAAAVPRCSITIGILLMGGECNGTKTFAQNESYDPKTLKWTTLAAMPAGRHGFYAVSDGQAVMRARRESQLRRRSIGYAHALHLTGSGGKHIRVNSQFPTPNSQLPTPKPWELGIGVGLAPSERRESRGVSN